LIQKNDPRNWGKSDVSYELSCIARNVITNERKSSLMIDIETLANIVKKIVKAKAFSESGDLNALNISRVETY
jgi:hypothetical protein